MSEKKPQQSHGALIWGIILLFLGIVFLLQVLDVLPWALWVTLWRFWPVLIIIIGLNILLRRRQPLGCERADICAAVGLPGWSLLAV